MPVTVHIPLALTRFTKDKNEVKLRGRTVNEVVSALEKKFPELRGKLVDETGDVKKFIKVFINRKDAAPLGGGQAAVADGDEITLIPAGLGG